MSAESIIIHEDEDLLVVNKPAGLSSLDERDRLQPSLLRVLQAYRPGVRLCHRIDRETSGVVVAAKSFPVYRHLTEQFRKREVSKAYHAVAWGRALFNEQEIDSPLRTIAVNYARGMGVSGNGENHIASFRAVVDRRKGRPSRTIVTTIKISRHASFLECRPITGRTHQIRIHLSQAGFPLIGDPLYRGQFLYLSFLKRGYQQTEEPERPIISRVALHARKICFRLFDRDCAFEAPYPKDFSALLKILTKYDELRTVDLE